MSVTCQLGHITRCSVLLALKTTDTLLFVCFYTCHTNMRYIVSPYPYSGNIHLFSWSNIHSILTFKCKVWPFLPVSGSQEIITTHYSNIKKEYHLFCTFCTLCSSLPQTVRRLLPSTVRTHFLKSEQKPNMDRSWNILSRINVRKCISMYIWTQWMIYVRAKWYQNVPSRTDYKVGWEENECFTLYKNRWSKCAVSPDWSHTC